jgi:DNA-binding response OmpR family regulator
MLPDLSGILLVHLWQVITRDRILERVWGYDFIANSNIIEVYIRYLRLKLESMGEQRLIQTARTYWLGTARSVEILGDRFI